jgi:hypothetical protein
LAGIHGSGKRGNYDMKKHISNILFILAVAGILLTAGASDFGASMFVVLGGVALSGLTAGLGYLIRR